MNENAALVEEYFGFAPHWLSTRPGEQMFYLDEGPADGTPVILLHGSAIGITGAANFYLTIPPLVAAGYRILAPDFYGWGFTEMGEGTLGHREDLIDQVVRFLDHLGIESAYMIGNSLGGFILADLAVEHPERMRGGVVVGNAGAKFANPRRPVDLLLGDNKKEYDPAMVRKTLLHMVYDPSTVTEKLIEFRTKVAELPGMYEKYLEAIRQREESKKRRSFPAEGAASSPVPMLFVFGERDRVYPPEDALAATEAFQHADLVVFGHCGHWTMIERADDFNELALRFMGGYDKHIVSPPKHSGELGGR